MSMQLRPCSACSRHVRAADATCPFCGARVSHRAEPRPAFSAAARLSRAALFAAGTAGAAMASTDCSAQPLYGGSIAQPAYGGVFRPDDASMKEEGSTALPEAGATPSESSTEGDSTAESDSTAAGEASTASDAAPDVPTAVAMYGGVAIPDSGPMKDDGPSVIALYGGFMPPMDADVKTD